jgi:hypothetical protein
LFFSCGPDPADYDSLRTPRIVEKPDTPALTAGFDGESSDVLAGAFRAVYKIYYRLKNVPKGKNAPAPAARYRGFGDVMEMSESSEEFTDFHWNGFVALPVPENTEIPPEAGDQGVRLEILEYGTVAEIVYFGPYEEETPTIRILRDFIESEGYVITGLHEEEYIRGPGFLRRPESYITIIRYQVEKK